MKREIKREKHRKSFSSTGRGRLASMLSIPESCFSGVPYLELHGDSTLSLTGYETLLFYDDNCIMFRMKRAMGSECKILRILGKGLALSALREGCLSVGGCIDAVILHGDADLSAGLSDHGKAEAGHAHT